MTIINSYEQYAELQKRYPRTLSNDFLMPQDIRALAERGNLRCIAGDSGLFTFIQREGFRKLIFRLRETSAVLPPIGEPIAAYLVYREGNPQTDNENWLRSQGFEHLMKLERYVCRGDLQSPANNHPVRFASTPPQRGIVATATADETYEFLHKLFGAEEMDLPACDMFDPADTFCVKADNGNLQGIVYDMGHTRIVAVSPDARGLGIGGKLYRAFMEKSLQNGKNPTFYEWIKPDNLSSIAMFKKLGFEKDTLVTDCYVRKN
jgi:GNAT superfamily N-acetyltransferase